MRTVGAGGVADGIGPTLQDLSSSQAAGPALIIGFASALWSASGYVRAFGRAMNRVTRLARGARFGSCGPRCSASPPSSSSWSRSPCSVLCSAGRSGRSRWAAGIGSTAVTIFSVVKWPVILAVVVLVVALLYYVTPNVKQPKVRWVSLGAVLANLTWALAPAVVGF